MSTIRKTPYIETALSLLTDTDKSDLLAIVNSATPVTTQVS